MLLNYAYKLSFDLLFTITLLAVNIRTCFARHDDEFNPDLSINDNFHNYSHFATYYFPEVDFFDKYFTIILFTVGFPGNFISFLVWSSKRMYHGNSAAVYVAALSLNDTVVLALALFRDLTQTWDVPFHPTAGSCEVLNTLTLTFQYASPLFVLAFTVERWMAICQPFMVSRICSVKRALRICICIILVTFVVCSPMAYLMATDSKGCQQRSPVVFHFTTTLEVIYSLLAPLLVLTFNCLVINEMAKIRRAQALKMIRVVQRNGDSLVDADGARPSRRLFRKSKADKSVESTMLTDSIPGSFGRRKTEFDRSGGEATSPKFRSTTIMLLVVSFYVIFATLLGGLWYLLDIKFSIDAYSNLPKREFDTRPEVARALKLRMIKIVCDELALSHFAMGFVLYFSTGKNFRAEVCRLFRLLGFCCTSERSENSLSNNLVRSSASYRVSRDERQSGNEGDSGPDTSNATVLDPRRKSKINVLKESIPFLKRGRSRDDFPGLEQCGHRGERLPSRLQVNPTVSADGDTLTPL
ncbi:hypothetical protein Aperf_G00000079445 [Anoplocephala perfoliata]